MNWRDQRGSSESVAFLGLMPLLLLVLLAVLQVMVFGYTLVVMESAARDGARAASAGDNAFDAVRTVAETARVPMKLVVSCPSKSPKVTVSVTAYVPRLFPFVTDNARTLERQVVMPREEDCP